MGWQFYTNILHGVDIPAGNKLSEKGDFRKNFQGDFFVPLWRETAIYGPKETIYGFDVISAELSIYVW